MKHIELYMFVLLGLIFFLAALTFFLLLKDKRRSEPIIHRLNTTYIITFFIMIICVLLIMAEHQFIPMVTLTNRDNYKISVKQDIEIVSREDAPLLDPDFYIDGNKIFYFHIPSNDYWTKPRVMSGLIAYLETSGMEINKTNFETFIQWNPYAELMRCITTDFRLNPYEQITECMEKNMQKSEYGNMLKASYCTYIQYGKPSVIQIKIPDSTGQVEQQYTNLTFVNYFNITVLDKKRMPEPNNRLTLANYFLHKTVNFASNIEKIIANENNILLAFSLQFQNAVIAKSNSSLTQIQEMSGNRLPLRAFRIHRWIRMIEDENMFYIIEIAYSPETDESSLIWNDIKSVFESVVILK